MSTNPVTHSGTTNEAASDASGGRKQDTTNWNDARKQTYEAVWNSTTKKSGS